MLGDVNAAGPTTPDSVDARRARARAHIRKGDLGQALLELGDEGASWAVEQLSASDVSDELQRRRADHRWMVSRLATGRRLVETARPVVALEGDASTFADLQGLPEVHSSDLTASRLADALAARGGLVVRQLLSSDQVRRLRGEIAFCRFLMMGIVEVGIDDEGRAAVAELGELATSPTGARCLVESYRDAGVTDIVEVYLGGPPVGLPSRTALRRKDRGPGLRWHQEAPFVGGRTQAIGVWTALTPVGDVCPGLEVVPRRLENLIGYDVPMSALLESPLPFDYPHWRPETFDAFVADHEPQVPFLAPGDALLFDEMTMHRTGVSPWKVPSREVAVTWFLAPSRFPRTLGVPYAL